VERGVAKLSMFGILRLLYSCQMLKGSLRKYSGRLCDWSGVFCRVKTVLVLGSWGWDRPGK
jgi:hypothetical protein